jgi:hypothetical protein
VFRNWQSRFLLKRLFQRQSPAPEEPLRLVEGLLRIVERCLVRPDVRGVGIDRPVFLVGMQRSGTTVLQDLCCTHPGLAYITNTMHQFPRCFCAAEAIRARLRLDARSERYLGDSVEVSPGSPNEGIKFWRRWFGWKPDNHNYVPRLPESFTPPEVGRIHETVRKVIWCFGRPWRRFFCKNPGFVTDLPRLAHIFPGARFLHIVRDPRQCANSMRKLYRLDKRQREYIRLQSWGATRHTGEWVPYPRVPGLADYLRQWGPDDVRTTAHVWNDAVTLVNKEKARLDCFLEVRFEDLVADPEGQMARVFAFCELPPPGPDNAAFRDRLAAVGRTKHRNDYGEFDVIEDICRDHMQALGYA